MEAVSDCCLISPVSPRQTYHLSQQAALQEARSPRVGGSRACFRQNLSARRLDEPGLLRAYSWFVPIAAFTRRGLLKKICSSRLGRSPKGCLGERGSASNFRDHQERQEARREGASEVWGASRGRDRAYPYSFLTALPIAVPCSGIQAFEPVSSRARAIQMHLPGLRGVHRRLDGDQMAVHAALHSAMEARSGDA